MNANTAAPIASRRLLHTPWARSGALVREDAGEGLVAEVDFKWLMAGLGWWVDTPRLHSDPAYAAQLLSMAMASDSVAVRAAAAALLEALPVPEGASD